MQCFLIVILAIFCFSEINLFPSGRKITKIVNHSSLPITLETVISDIHTYPDFQFYQDLSRSMLKIVIPSCKSHTLAKPICLNQKQLLIFVPAVGISTRVYEDNVTYDKGYSEDVLFVTSSYTYGQIIPIEGDEVLDLENDNFLTIKSQKIIRFDRSQNSKSEGKLLKLRDKNKLYRFYEPGEEEKLEGETTFYYDTDNLTTVLHIYDPQSGQEEIRFY